MSGMTLDPVLAVVLVPASALTGFAAASMSFTAWNLVCPLLFSVFGLPVFPALFVSVMLDVTNGLTLTYLYGRNGKVDFKYGVIFGSVSLAWAVLMSLLVSDFIYNHQDALKSAVSFVPLLIALQFFIRGMLAWRKKRREAVEAAATSAGVPSINSSTYVDTAPSILEADAARGRALSAAAHLNPETQPHGHKEFLTEPLEIAHHFVVVTGGLKDAEPRGRSSSVVSADAPAAHLLADRAPDYGGLSAENGKTEYHDGTVSGTARGVFWRFVSQFKPEEDILAQQTGSKGWRIGVTLLINSILGIVSGVLFAGGGMFFANVIVNFWTAKVRTAAGTGCLIMTIVMTSMSFTFIGRIDMNDIVNFYHLLIALPFGVIGAILGAKLALRISDLVMYFVIVGVSLVLFTVIAVNGIFASETPSDSGSSNF